MTVASSKPRRVVVESPFAGHGPTDEDIARDHAFNVRYARKCVLDCLRRGEAPFASHLLYTQVLQDLDPEERTLGIMAGLSWVEVADATVVYEDFGLSPGMKLGIVAAEQVGRVVERRRLFAEGVTKAEALGEDDEPGYLR